MIVTANNYREFLSLVYSDADPCLIEAKRDRLADFAKHTAFRIDNREVKLMNCMLEEEGGKVELTSTALHRYGIIIRKLSHLKNDLVFTDTDTGEIKTFGGSYFSVRNSHSDKSGFLTANHCVQHYEINPYFHSANYAPGNKIMIGGQEIIIPISRDYVNLPDDTAFLKNKYAVPLPFAAAITDTEPQIGERLYTVGKPHNGKLQLTSVDIQSTRLQLLRDIIIPEFGSMENYIEKVIKPLTYVFALDKYRDGKILHLAVPMSLQLIPKCLRSAQQITISTDLTVSDVTSYAETYSGNKRVVSVQDFVDERIGDKKVKNILNKYSFFPSDLPNDTYYFIKVVAEQELLYGHASAEYFGGESGSIMFNAKGEVVGVLSGSGGETKLSLISYAAPAIGCLE
jgi:hypothetical protein